MLDTIEIIIPCMLVLALSVNSSVKAFKKRKQKIHERKLIAGIDWQKVKEAIEPPVRQGGCDLNHSCLFWATVGKHFLKYEFGLDCHIWRGKAAVCWLKLSNTKIAANRKVFLDAATECAKERSMSTTGNYHVWLETREYIIDLAQYSKSLPCPNNLLIIRRAEPTVYHYIPECEVLPTIGNGCSTYEIAGFRFTLPTA
jgi:hypothetical protein